MPQKCGTLELPHNSELINIEVVCTPEPTIEIEPSSSNASIVNTRPTSTPKTHHSPTPPPKNLQFSKKFLTITLISFPPRKKYIIYAIIKYRILRSWLHWLWFSFPCYKRNKKTSQSNTMTGGFLRTHPLLKPISLLFRWLPLPMNFVFCKIKTSTTMLHILRKIYKNSRFGKVNAFVSTNSNSIFPNLHNMILILTANDITTAPSVKKFNHQTHKIFLDQKHPQNFF